MSNPNDLKFLIVDDFSTMRRIVRGLLKEIGCANAEEARRKAERLAPNRLGVVAYSVTADVELGDYDESPTLLFKAGQLPPPWDDA